MLNHSASFWSCVDCPQSAIMLISYEITVLSILISNPVSAQSTGFNFAGADCCPFIESDLVEYDLPALVAANRIRAGPYDIVNCNATEARILNKTVTAMRHSAKHTAIDARRGVRSSHGFWALFNTDQNQPFVKETFQKIAKGASLSLYPTGDPDEHRPTFLCASKHSPGLPKTLHKQCEDAIASVTTDRHNVVSLCPAFWTLPTYPSNVCPRVRRNGKMDPSILSFTPNKVSCLTHETVHIYAGFHHPEEFREAYSLQQCIDLDDGDSVKNAQNFVNYAYGKLMC